MGARGFGSPSVEAPGFVRIAELGESDLRRAFGHFPSGVAAACGWIDDAPAGISVSSFTSVSLRPALVLICVADSSETWPKLRRLPSIGLSVIAQHDGEIARALASRRDDRFDRISYVRSGDSTVFIRPSPLWLECEPYQELHSGDHEIVVLRVTGVVEDPAVEPIVFHRSGFRSLA